MLNPDKISENRYDLPVIRPKAVADDVQFRGRDVSKADPIKIRKALRTFHRLEMMTVNIYRFQITKIQNETNRQLIIAMNNEVTHVQDFQSKLYESGRI